MELKKHLENNLDMKFIFYKTSRARILIDIYKKVKYKKYF